ncbi:MAG: hypothetical protein MK404_06310 [SAR324 cluster bacterium]|jgi:hypothetical protein|uniref:Flagellar assembly protein T N-terminal domain-containing protein n=1 Tax=SAR324 cluster bacterium TaxID=2024889 RepID=A0A432GAY5_9DELT|nr:hypothetical protein [SAR324 cluster bacterium]MCH2271538.1 hypothetical protein [SAR324 cluster bacterium]MCH2282695.1 hypothetical protein [SAR324 cluster bacterium]RTZ80728.1 MAG: hypothetical protein DSY97_02660 [SAR324 cluster bacterium]HIN00492.1 hypothetical protein [Deltaproteobacteria bacterium]
MRKLNLILSIILGLALLLSGCAAKKADPKPENFLTLADLTGRVTLKEDSPGVRVIRIKAKAFIKRNDIRAAKAKAMEVASAQAVDVMVRELLPDEDYNNNFEDIEQYLSKNIQKYIVSSEVNDEKKIFDGKYYGLDTAHKVNRQKVLVALQKDLKLINNSASTIVPVITSRKDIDLSKSGFTFRDLEDAMMNQIQTDLNQRGLRAMDFRNAVTSVQTDEKVKKQFAKISKEQFMAIVSGSPADRALLDPQIQDAEAFYTTGLSLLKQMAKVVVEVNIFAVSGNIKGDLALSLNVTAKNVSTGRGGAFANSVINVARRGGPSVIPSAMITGLVKDAYEDMQKEFIPQVIKEMSTISIGGKRLIAYELVLKDFGGAEVRKLRTKLKQSDSDEFRYISYDNSVPTIVTIIVRHAGNVEDLADKVMIIFDSAGIKAKEPIVAPDLTDLVFVRIPDED